MNDLRIPRNQSKRRLSPSPLALWSALRKLQETLESSENEILRCMWTPRLRSGARGLSPRRSTTKLELLSPEDQLRSAVEVDIVRVGADD